MVLYVFVVAYVGGVGAAAGRRRPAPALRSSSVAVRGRAVRRAGDRAARHGPDGARHARARRYAAGFGTPAEIGTLFLTKFLVAFEVASLLLLIAAVGAVILARRRSGLDDAREISVADAAARRQPDGTVDDARRARCSRPGGRRS